MKKKNLKPQTLNIQTDLSANMAVARAGLVGMAASACIGGPLLSLTHSFCFCFCFSFSTSQSHSTQSNVLDSPVEGARVLLAPRHVLLAHTFVKPGGAIFFSSVLLSSLELSDTQVDEP